MTTGRRLAHRQRVDPQQLAQLKLLLIEVEGGETKLAALFGIDALSNLPVSRFGEAVSALYAKRWRK